jgi:NHLM bacteriocin system ABC transporter ATP-binding protein
MDVVSTPARGTFALRIVACADRVRVGQEVRIADEGTIGRDPSCTIALNDTSVSRRHARIERLADGLRIVDLQSSNGIWIGTSRLPEITLHAGEKFQIGSTIFECIRDGDAAVEESPATMMIQRPVIARPPAAPPVPAPPVPAPPVVVPPISGLPAATPPASSLPPTGPVAVPVPAPPVVVPKPAPVPPPAVVVKAPPPPPAPAPAPPRPPAPAPPPPVQAKPPAPPPPPRPAPPPPRENVTMALPMQDVEPHTIAMPVSDFQEPRTMALSLSEVAEPSTMAISPADLVDSPRTMAIPVPSFAPPAAATPSAPAAPPAAPAGPEPGTTAELFAREAPALAVSAHEPFLLNDPDAMYYIETGGILIFTVGLEKGVPHGTRAHFLDIDTSQCLFGFDLLRIGASSGFLAVARQGTTLRKLKVSRLREMTGRPALAKLVAPLIDTWIQGLAKALARDLPAKRIGEIALKPGEPISLKHGQKVSCPDGVLWVNIYSGSVLFDDIIVPAFARRHTLLPLTAHSWLQPVSEEFGELAFTPTTTAKAIGTAPLWQGLDVFHDVLCECQFLNKKLGLADEFVRLRQKAQYADASREAAYDVIGSVLRAEPATPKEFFATGSTEPVLRAAKIVGAAQGIEVRAHPGAAEDHATEDMTYGERVNTIAIASNFRTRTVALREDWWTQDQGPLLGQIEATKLSVALVPTSARSYVLVDPAAGTRTKIDAEVGATLAPFAYTFYRPLPEGVMSAGKLAKFGVQGLKGDFRMLLFTAAAVGMFGTVTPMITGRIFDSAIPQADRGTLFAFGLALMGTAVATSMFKLVQGVASLRVQSKMEYSLQAAMWDRLLVLPTSFFRKYSAGDLSDRAGGVDQIQQLVSGAGVASILGSLSGLFFVAQMLSYNMHLAGLAVLLTMVYVSVNMAANYLQLRHQRVEVQMRGRIGGLVLNLITGVTKLRICGAEDHAFRVWAQQFAAQRRISFKIGTIQSMATTFGAIFPVLSSIALFLLMMSEQESAAETGQVALTTGEFIAFTSAYGMFLGAMQALGDASLNLLRIVPIYERLKPLITTTPEIDGSKAFPGKLKGEIELSHINFRYSEDGPWILRDVSLKIRAGEFVAFVGGSGSGKSTLMRLMLGFEVPASGTLYFDGQDLGSLDLRMVRQQMGVVLQVSRVMPTEMYRNIIGAGSRTIDDAWRAAEMAGLADDIRAMPMGMHTYVSEGGGTLSGGQRQRLLIARAIVNRPKIMFLDEATSALDNRAQAIVTESLDRLDSTRIVIAHRLTTIQNADQICYLEQGKIAEKGTYQELMDKNGLFAALARRQMV